MKFHIDDLPVSPKAFDSCAWLTVRRSSSLMTESIQVSFTRVTGFSSSVAITEQYSYMCDLKRTLDAQVRETYSPAAPV